MMTHEHYSSTFYIVWFLVNLNCTFISSCGIKSRENSSINIRNWSSKSCKGFSGGTVQLNMKLGKYRGGT